MSPPTLFRNGDASWYVVLSSSLPSLPLLPEPWACWWCGDCFFPPEIVQRGELNLERALFTEALSSLIMLAAEACAMHARAIENQVQKEWRGAGGHRGF